MIDTQRSSQKWIFWLLLSITSIYLVLNLDWVLRNQQQRNKLQTTLNALPLLIPVQHLTQQLQAERGMLAGFATQQLPKRPPIELQQLQSDAAWRELNIVVANNLAITDMSAIYLSMLPQQQTLFLLRQNILEQRLSSSAVKRAYTALLQPLLHLAEQLQQNNELSGLAHPLSVLVALTEALERAGQERATLHLAFAEQQMLPSRYQSYVILVNEQTAYLEQFADLLAPELRQQWLQIQSQFENGSFIELREQALAQQFDGDATMWFELASNRINIIYEFRLQLCLQLQQQALAIEQQLGQARQQLVAQLQCLLIILLLLCWRLYRLHTSGSRILKQVRHSPQF
jgi:flagellar biogenesis protein FliO